MAFGSRLKNRCATIFSKKIFGPTTFTSAESAHSSNQSARAYSNGSDG